MKEVSPLDIRQKLRECDMKGTQVYKICGIGRAWFLKMFSPNPKYRFIEPNQERMQLIMKFLVDYEGFKRAWKKKNVRKG